jgi:hypothetical protein
MTHLIDKDALVAEFNRLITELVEEGENTMFEQGRISAFEDAKLFLDTLEVKEQLTWQDVRLISEIGEDFMNSEESDSLNEEEYYTEILRRFKAQKGEEV